MMDEVLTMQFFDHPNVMSLIGVCVDGGAGPSIIMPYMANGSLLNFLKKERENVIVGDDKDPDTVNAVQKLLLNVCLQIAKGMEYLARQKFVHRDLAARNCMINQTGVIKVSDFGLTESIYTSGYYRQNRSDAAVRLPYKWLPLESLQDSVYTEKSDVWSFGVTCWEVFNGGKGPYAGMDPWALVKMLESGLRLERPHNTACTEEIFALFLKCWHTKPESRPSFNDLVTEFSQVLESVAGYLELMALPVSDSQENLDTGESDIHSHDEKESTSGVLKE